MKYNFDVLNDKEFEDLCKDLLDQVYAVDFQVFKAGKDGGIDLLYAGSVGNEIVVQVKHYIASTFQDLKKKLQNDELEKIKKMIPTPLRYVVATSLPLSPQQTREVKEILKPFVRSTDDIFGRRRLESILSKYGHIEEKFFKLWLTSTNVMLRILNNAVINNSEFHKQQILHKTKRYVVNDDFAHAVAILKEHQFLIITGQPGVGKTTLAYMLICERMANGCDLIFSDGKISEVEGMLSHDPKKKQIFFVDDFLGANLHDIQNPKNPENKIISFVAKIQSYKNKYLVFTSRTTILNQATHRYENLRRSRITNDSKYELELKNYSDLNKAKILYNHLYFNSVGSMFTRPFFQKEVYTKIIKHVNFFPRLIEFVTDVRHYDGENYDSVEEFVFYQLDHPEEIWKHAFENQLDDEDRFLVMSLFSLGGNYVADDILQDSFSARYDYELNHSALIRKPLAYRNSLRKVLDGFVLAGKYGDDDQNRYSFLNPSILDFLFSFLREDQEEQKAILNSIAYIDQLRFWFGNSEGKIPINKKLLPKIFRNIISKLDEIGSIKPGSRPLNLLETLFEYFPLQMQADLRISQSLMVEILKDTSVVDPHQLSMIMLMSDVFSDDSLFLFIKDNLYGFVNIILRDAQEDKDLAHLAEIFNQFSADFKSYIHFGGNKELLEFKLSCIFESYAKDIDFDEGRIIEANGEMGRSYAETMIEDNLWNEYTEFLQRINLDDFYDELEHSFDVSAEEIIDRILDNLDYDDGDDGGYRGTIRSDFERPKDEWDDIDRLFS